MKFTRFNILFLMVLVMALAVPSIGRTAGVVDPPACAINSWSPELFSFYGDRATVLAKFQKLDRDLLKHRVYAFIVESNQGSKLTFFEVEKDGSTMDLASATAPSFTDLSNQISTTLLANTGKKCAGMASKDLVTSYTKGQMVHAAIPRVASVSEAFNYAVTLADGEYIRATFILLC